MDQSKITIITGTDLNDFYAALGMQTPANVYSVRVWQQSDGTVKVKKNGGIWTWALGQQDGA